MGGFPCPLYVLMLPDDFAEDLEALVFIDLNRIIFFIQGDQLDPVFAVHIFLAVWGDIQRLQA